MKQPTAATAWNESTILKKVTRDGFGWFRSDRWTPSHIEAAPLTFLKALLGDDMVARYQFMEVKPRPHGTTIVTSNAFATFHTDGDSWLPAHLQILVCDRAAPSGGESMMLDGWQLMRRIKAQHPAMHEAMLNTVRAIRYNEHLWLGPTVAYRDDSLVINHAPDVTDELGQFVAREIQREEFARFRMNSGDFYVSNNHRVLHARTAFQGERRLLRFMVWLKKPIRAPAQLERKAARVTSRIARMLGDKPKFVQACFGLGQRPRTLATTFSPRRLGALQQTLNELSQPQ